MVKIKTKDVKYYLDETDQIEVDGHTLSRLYLAPGVVDKVKTRIQLNKQIC